jgi:hypothetical protein
MMPDPTASAAQSPLGTPLILDAKSELLFFKTAAHLEAYVEAVDVANGEYGDCWDAEGRLLKLYIESQPSTVLGIVPYRREVVRVTAAEDRASHLTDLHLALLRHLAAVGLEGEMPVTNETADLLTFAIEHAGWS